MMIWPLLLQSFVALITGGSGYLGGHVVETFLKEGCQTIVLIRNESYASNRRVYDLWSQNYPNNFHVICHDISDTSGSIAESLLGSRIIESLSDINCIVNCASPFERYFDSALKIIVEPTIIITRNVLNFATTVQSSRVDVGLKDISEGKRRRNLRVVHVSSSAALRGPGQKSYKTSCLQKTLNLSEDIQLSTSEVGAAKMTISDTSFSPLDWNACSQFNGSGMQPYQFVKTLSEQMMFESGLKNGFDVISIVPVTMLGPICEAQEYARRHTLLAPDGKENSINSNQSPVRKEGVSAQFIKDWAAFKLKQENRLIADVRDVAIAILEAASIDVNNIVSEEAQLDAVQSALTADTSTIAEVVLDIKNVTELYSNYDLKSSSVRNRVFRPNRFIVGGSRRVPHSGIENLLLSNGYVGGSLTATEAEIRNNAAFRTEVDELDISATVRSMSDGGLGIICRKWEDTILDTAEQYYPTSRE